MGEALRVKDIADRVGVSASTISNWKRLFPDFPAPVGITDKSGPNGKTEVWDLDEVKAWAKEHGLPDKTKTRAGKRDQARDDVILNHLERLSAEVAGIRQLLQTTAPTVPQDRLQKLWKQVVDSDAPFHSAGRAKPTRAQDAVHHSLIRAYCTVSGDTPEAVHERLQKEAQAARDEVQEEDE